MFSGLIETTGTILALDPLDLGQRLTLSAPDLDRSDIKLGDSIALNGVCLTVIEYDSEKLVFVVSGETLRCAHHYHVGQRVNLEKALRLGDRLGGHIVLGHVDGMADVVAYHQDGNSADESWQLVIRVPAEFTAFVANKGSITLNGVSLTTNRVEDSTEGCLVHFTLIPHTRLVTSLGELKVNDKINIEIDMMARYACRYLSVTQAS